MFRKLIQVCLVVATALCSLTAKAYSSDVIRMLKDVDDRPIPFPLDATLPFPWGSIEGSWEARKGDFVAYFAFKMVRKSDGGNQLRVRQIDVETCQTAATGVGLSKDDVVRAQMKDLKGQVYRLAVRALDHTKVPEYSVSMDGQIMGMSFSFVGNQIQATRNVIITKVSQRYDWNCESPQLKF